MYDKYMHSHIFNCEHWVYHYDNTVFINLPHHLTAQALPGLNPLDHASRLTLLPHQDVQHLAWDDVNDDDGDFVDDGDSDGLGLPRGAVSLLCR